MDEPHPCCEHCGAREHLATISVQPLDGGARTQLTVCIRCHGRAAADQPNTTTAPAGADRTPHGRFD